MIIFILSILLFLIANIGFTVNEPSQRLLLNIASGIAMAYCVLWLPFKRHQEQEEAHGDAIDDLKQSHLEQVKQFNQNHEAVVASLNSEIAGLRALNENQLQLEAVKSEVNVETENLTQKGFIHTAAENTPIKRVFDAMLSLRVCNPNSIRQITGIQIKIIDIQPPMDGKKVEGKVSKISSPKVLYPNSALCNLKGIGFSFIDVRGDTLNGGTSAKIKLLTANIPPGSDQIEDITVSFGGEWKSSQPNEFTPKESHEITIQVSAANHPSFPLKFTLKFAPKEPIVELIPKP